MYALACSRAASAWLPCQPTHAQRAQAVDRKNLVVVLALGVASGCVLGFLAAAVFLQCSWAAAHLAAAAGVATLSPRFSACPPVVCEEPSAALLGACGAGVLAFPSASVTDTMTRERGAQAVADGRVSALASEARGAKAQKLCCCAVCYYSCVGYMHHTTGRQPFGGTAGAVG